MSPSGLFKQLALCCCVIAALTLTSRADDEFTKKATWSVPTADGVKEQALSWLAGQQLDAAAKTQIEALWNFAAQNEGGEHTLNVLAATLAAGDPRAAALVEHCNQPRRSVKLPNVDWLYDTAAPPLVRNNLRLLYARWLVQESLYDEAATQMAGLEPTEVVDPAGLLFFRAVVEHRALSREAGLRTISQLLEQDQAIARRYTSIAKLMRADLELLEDDSLDHIARRMDDIRRRLDLGRAGEKELEVEDGVIASLDKLIKETEQKQQQQQQHAAAAQRAARERARQQGRQGQERQQRQPRDGERPPLDPLNPLDDSRAMSGKGEGEVDDKPIGQQSGWGDLPEHQRKEALQQIGQDFPAHYRDMIEQYFRRLANQEESEK